MVNSGTGRREETGKRSAKTSTPAQVGRVPGQVHDALRRALLRVARARKRRRHTIFGPPRPRALSVVGQHPNDDVPSNFEPHRPKIDQTFRERDEFQKYRIFESVRSREPSRASSE